MLLVSQLAKLALVIFVGLGRNGWPTVRAGGGPLPDLPMLVPDISDHLDVSHASTELPVVPPALVCDHCGHEGWRYEQLRACRVQFICQEHNTPLPNFCAQFVKGWFYQCPLGDRSWRPEILIKKCIMGRHTLPCPGTEYCKPEFPIHYT
ncbi:hypothetical protein MJO29_010231 [Puccinia striiformis f. sp. tritici]|nr:hypothetical protein MJO29_010231 [Puccinia striiformis f. sp. tritici]KAI9623810.1 hypothetical protein KEM48_009305 [Puccinia striiformis f. sp. tritici PST-130]